MGSGQKNHQPLNFAQYLDEIPPMSQKKNKKLLVHTMASLCKDLAVVGPNPGLATKNWRSLTPVRAR